MLTQLLDFINRRFGSAPWATRNFVLVPLRRTTGGPGTRCRSISPGRLSSAAP